MAETKSTETKRIHLKVLTPFAAVYDDLVDFVILKTTEGDMGVMYGHENCSEQMQFSLTGLSRSLRIFTEGEEREPIMVMGGIVTVEHGCVTIMSDMAHPPKDFFAAVEKRRAEMDMHKQKVKEEELAVRRAETSIRRALVQMDRSAFAILQQNWQSQDDQ